MYVCACDDGVGQELERIQTSYSNYIAQECICKGKNIVPNFQMIISDKGINPIEGVAKQGAQVGLVGGHIE